MPTEKAGVPPPYPLAMVICDAVHVDPGTNKAFILGCFSAIFAPSFPATHPSMGVYIALTDGYGKVPFKLRLVDVDEEHEPLFEVEGEVEFQDPREVREQVFTLHGMTYPAAGEYRLQLVFAAGGAPNRPHANWHPTMSNVVTLPGKQFILRVNLPVPTNAARSLATAVPSIDDVRAYFSPKPLRRPHRTKPIK